MKMSIIGSIEYNIFGMTMVIFLKNKRNDLKSLNLI